MPDSDNLPAEALVMARDAFLDLVGHQAYLAWLDGERQRVRAHLQETHGVTPEASLPDDLLDRLVDTLSEYGDQSKYRSIKGKPAPILADGGEAARQMLVLIERAAGQEGGE